MLIGPATMMIAAQHLPIFASLAPIRYPGALKNSGLLHDHPPKRSIEPLPMQPLKPSGYCPYFRNLDSIFLRHQHCFVTTWVLLN
jgi:hypothetical protein